MAEEQTLQQQVTKELKSQGAKALAAGVVGGLVAASVAAWGVVKNWPGLLGLVPTGAIMAFPTPCASGWADYKLATGRVIVGAGTAYSEDRKYYSWKQVQIDGTSIEIRLTAYSVLDAGGEELHILSTKEMPAHNHSISTRRNASASIHDALGGSPADHGIDQVFDPSAPADSGYGVLPRVIGPSGGGAGHNTMPPYIALYWCQKT